MQPLYPPKSYNNNKICPICDSSAFSVTLMAIISGPDTNTMTCGKCGWSCKVCDYSKAYDEGLIKKAYKLVKDTEYTPVKLSVFGHDNLSEELEELIIETTKFMTENIDLNLSKAFGTPVSKEKLGRLVLNLLFWMDNRGVLCLKKEKPEA